jgi:hypothetical protein
VIGSSARLEQDDHLHAQQNPTEEHNEQKESKETIDTLKGSPAQSAYTQASQPTVFP